MTKTVSKGIESVMSVTPDDLTSPETKQADWTEQSARSDKQTEPSESETIKEPVSGEKNTPRWRNDKKQGEKNEKKERFDTNQPRKYENAKAEPVAEKVIDNTIPQSNGDLPLDEIKPSSDPDSSRGDIIIEPTAKEQITEPVPIREERRRDLMILRVLSIILEFWKLCLMAMVS